jgi:hypothetical protein
MKTRHIAMAVAAAAVILPSIFMIGTSNAGVPNGFPATDKPQTFDSPAKFTNAGYDPSFASSLTGSEVKSILDACNGAVVAGPPFAKDAKCGVNWQHQSLPKPENYLFRKSIGKAMYANCDPTNAKTVTMNYTDTHDQAWSETTTKGGEVTLGGSIGLPKDSGISASITGSLQKEQGTTVSDSYAVSFQMDKSVPPNSVAFWLVSEFQQVFYGQFFEQGQVSTVNPSVNYWEFPIGFANQTQTTVSDNTFTMDSQDLKDFCGTPGTASIVRPLDAPDGVKIPKDRVTVGKEHKLKNKA